MITRLEHEVQPVPSSVAKMVTTHYHFLRSNAVSIVDIFVGNVK